MATECAPHRDLLARAATTRASGSTARSAGQIRYVLVCDDCGQETREVFNEPYVPNPLLGPGAGFLPA